MRSVHLTRLATMTGAVFLTGACASAGGVAGVTTLPPPPTIDMSAPPAETAAAAPARSSQHPDGSGGTTRGHDTPSTGTPEPTPESSQAPEPSQTPSGEQGTPDASAEATPEPSPETSTDESDDTFTVQRPPVIEPVLVPPPKLSEHTYAFPVKDCKVKYARKLLVLPKTTIWAKRGCAFVSPTDGTVHEVRTVDRWSPATDRGGDREGRFVTVFGEDGVLYLGGHLDSVAKGIKPGVKVKAGQVLGRVGNSGNARATATNLYFAISWKTEPSLWWVRRGMVEPWDYLDAWRNGNRTYSPSPEVAALRHKLGRTPRCTVQCGGDNVVVNPRPTPRPTSDDDNDKKKPTKKKRSSPTPTPDSTVLLPRPPGT